MSSSLNAMYKLRSCLPPADMDQSDMIGRINGLFVEDDYLVREVLPFCGQCFPSDVAVVLAKAVVWRAFDNKSDPPQRARDLLRAARSALRRRLGADALVDHLQQPVRKILLIVCATGDSVVLQHLEFEDLGAHSNARRADGHEQETGVTSRASILGTRLVHAMGEQLDMQAKELKTIDSKLSQIAKQIELLNKVYNRARRAPVRLEREETDAHAALEQRDDTPARTHCTLTPQGARPATLSSCPRSLHDIWDEWQNGMAGRKPAKNFTSSERGKVKFTFCRRKAVWDAIESLVQKGWDASDACDHVHALYGSQLSVSKVIQKLTADKRCGGHPAFR